MLINYDAALKIKFLSFVRKNLSDITTLGLGNYPGFIYHPAGVSNSTDPIVFVFHEVEPTELEQVLLFLKQNGYSTIDCAQLRVCDGNRSAASKTIMLTFDDGHISLWKYAFPLLKRYGFKAVSFICPGLVPEADTDAAGEARKLCNWSEIKQMHESGWIDFQSHGLYHDLVFASDKLITFFRPGFQSHFAGDKHFPLLARKGSFLSFSTVNCNGKVAEQAYYGTPIFTLRPSMAAVKRFEPAAETIEHLQRFVTHHGGKEYFKRKDWKKVLLGEFNHARHCRLDKHVEGESYQSEIREEFIVARKIMESKLSGKQVQHFSAPWCQATEGALRMASQNGYATAFMGMTGFHAWRIRRLPNSQFAVIPRLPDDYIFCLPGRERRPLREIIVRRLRGRPRYTERAVLQ